MLIMMNLIDGAAMFHGDAEGDLIEGDLIEGDLIEDTSYLQGRLVSFNIKLKIL